MSSVEGLFTLMVKQFCIHPVVQLRSDVQLYAVSPLEEVLVDRTAAMWMLDT